MTVTPTIHTSRLHLRPDGLWEIHGDIGEVMAGPDGEGLTKERAEELLDELERMAAERS